MKIAILGSTGMLGHEVERIFQSEGFEVRSVNRDKINAQFASTGEIQASIAGCSWIINCIGIIKTHIAINNSQSVQQAIQVNGLFPHKLADAAKNVGAKVIQIATDCVYDGQKGLYVETDPHNATDVYGKTKSLGEVEADNVMSLRCSIIGKELKGKTSLLEWFLNQPQNATVTGYKNHFWNGVTTSAFGKICTGIIKNDFWVSGLQHVVPADVVTKAKMLFIFKKIFSRHDISINSMNTNVRIDRSISTNNPDINKILWTIAGYREVPTIKCILVMEYGNDASGNQK
jgi:dTDP-4-dehydrorhamnose reductase